MNRCCNRITYIRQRWVNYYFLNCKALFYCPLLFEGESLAGVMNHLSFPTQSTPRASCFKVRTVLCVPIVPSCQAVLPAVLPAFSKRARSLSEILPSLLTVATVTTKSRYGGWDFCSVCRQVLISFQERILLPGYISTPITK